MDPNQEIILDPNKSLEKTPADIIMFSGTVPKSIQESPFKRSDSIKRGQLTRIIMNCKRVVPHCYRRMCKNTQFHHRITCKNTKYRKQIQKKQENNNNHETIILDSPITIYSSSIEEISSCNLSSDLDDIDTLIKKTRQRMNNKKVISSAVPITRSVDTPSIHSEESNQDNGGLKINPSFHSMETLVLQPDFNNIAYSPTMSPGFVDDSSNISPPISPIDLIRTKRNIYGLQKHISLSKTPSPEKEVLNKYINISCDTNENSDISPLYEISGKSFMERYLNNNMY